MPTSVRGFPSTPLPDDHSLLADLQCNILTPHRCDFSAHLFITLPDTPAKGLAYIKSQAIRVTKESDHHRAEMARREGKKQFLAEKANLLRGPELWEAKRATVPRGPVTSFMLSMRGLAAAGINHPMEGEEPFSFGMRKRERHLALSALPGDGVADWQAAFKSDLIHAHILLAASNEGALDKLVSAERIHFEKAGCIEVPQSERRGRVVKRGPAGRKVAIEHFGYADGIGNPTFLKSDSEYAKTRWGKPNEFPLDNVLFTPTNNGVAAGSFCVFRQMEQHTETFAALAKGKGDAIIGRRQDGSPLVKSGAGPNDFTYANDPAGTGCPFHAHIRKSNPRGASEESKTEPDALFARRGMLYGERTFTEGTDINGDYGKFEAPVGEVGMLFMGYMRSIKEQFERIQRSWYAPDDFPMRNSGPEQLVGLPPVGPGLVTVRGGEHFFVPTISWLTNL